jgi:pSer/pThr/pTyr-binding forkhead associated (FHA) protein
MAKLVVLTQSMAGRSYDLAAERTTVGRVEDNAFQLAEPSVSSHHCEILLRSGDVVVKDLDSTNGSFINGEKITESVLKPGQTLRLGNIELKLEVPGAPAAPAPSKPPPPPPPKKEPVKAAAGGISLSELETGGGRTAGFDSTTVFSKKKKGAGKYFWIGAGIVLFVIICLIFYSLSLVNTHK